jgi:hypothetical protein
VSIWRQTIHGKFAAIRVKNKSCFAAIRLRNRYVAVFVVFVCKRNRIFAFAFENDETMRDMIAFCGLDCEVCDAYIAKKNDDQALREKTARLWSELNHATILPSQINCDGCRVEGVKTVFCATMCQIRRCAMRHRVSTCGDCAEMENCPTVGALHANRPDARKNLLEK